MRILSRLLKQKPLSKRRANKAALTLMILTLLSINSSCGKRKVPLPPIERVSQKVTIEGFQRGNQVRLSWTMPARNASDASLYNINRADVYRLAEPTDSSLTLSEEEFSSRSTLIATLPISSNDFGLKKLNFTDSLEFAGQPVRLRYAVRLVNSQNQKAGFSNFLLIEPTARVAAAPESLKAELYEDFVKLEWTAPQSNIDDSKPLNLLGYNVYRSSSPDKTAEPVNNTPVTKTEFLDRTFAFGGRYVYFVRSVSLGSSGNPVESAESNTIDVSAEDTFPPTPPTALTIAAAPGYLSVFFAVNPEKDIAGYKIFRSEDKNLPLGRWDNLTPLLLTTNTFQDKKVEHEKTYYYYLLAVDKNGNESRPSEIVSETAP